jgi:hypothetical protein
MAQPAVVHLLEPLFEGWQRGLAIVAHPDDLEFEAAAAIARWTEQGKHYGDNNETPTMPATCLADHDFLATPAGRHGARRNTSCYWRQLSLEMLGEVKRACPLHAGRPAVAVGQAQLNARPPQPTAGTLCARPTRTLGLAQASRYPQPLAHIAVV